MKLIYCPTCNDIVKLLLHARTCTCMNSGGIYKNRLEAEIWGNAIPIGFNNFSLSSALSAQERDGDLQECLPGTDIVKGRRFEAFVIPDSAPTVVKQVVGVSHED